MLLHYSYLANINNCMVCRILREIYIVRYVNFPWDSLLLEEVRNLEIVDNNATIR